MSYVVWGSVTHLCAIYLRVRQAPRTERPAMGGTSSPRTSSPVGGAAGGTTGIHTGLLCSFVCNRLRQHRVECAGPGGCACHSLVCGSAWWLPLPALIAHPGLCDACTAGETGSYRYMAPEVFRHELYNNKVGCLVKRLFGWSGLQSRSDRSPLFLGLKPSAHQSLGGS
jgi:hypothetical protein